MKFSDAIELMIVDLQGENLLKKILFLNFTFIKIFLQYINDLLLKMKKCDEFFLQFSIYFERDRSSKC